MSGNNLEKCLKKCLKNGYKISVNFKVIFWVISGQLFLNVFTPDF